MKRKLIVVCISISLSGCLTNIDKQWHEVNVKFRQGNDVFAALTDSYAAKVEELASSFYKTEQEIIDKDWNDFLALHTSPDGLLVSQDDAGKIVSLSKTDLQTAMQNIQNRRDALDKKYKDWLDLHNKFKEALKKFQLMTASTGATEDQIIQAKQSAQQFLDTSLTTLSSFAAGALAMPK